MCELEEVCLRFEQYMVSAALSRFGTVAHFWSVRSKCPCLPGGWDKANCCKWMGEKSLFKSMFRPVYLCTWLTDFHQTGQHILLESHRFMSCRLFFVLLGLQQLSVSSKHCPMPLPVSHLLSRRLLFVEKGLTERVLFHLTYNASRTLYVSFLGPTLITTQHLSRS